LVQVSITSSEGRQLTAKTRSQSRLRKNEDEKRNCFKGTN